MVFVNCEDYSIASRETQNESGLRIVFRYIIVSKFVDFAKETTQVLPNFILSWKGKFCRHLDYSPVFTCRVVGRQPLTNNRHILPFSVVPVRPHVLAV